MGKAKNTVERVISGLEIDENIELHIKAWRFQPFAWAVITLFIMAGLFGFFGTGPISSTSVQKAGIQVAFQQYHRQGLILPISFFSEKKGIEIAIPHHFLSACRIETVIPEPISSNNAGEFMVYRFSGSDCSFFLRPDRSGSHRPNLLINGVSIPISIFIYP